MSTVFIAWSPHNSRSEFFARRLGAQSHFVHVLQRGKRYQLPFRYLVQGWRTWMILTREHPDTIFVQNPPIVCVLLVSLYARLFGARYVVDSHTGAFISKEWGWSLPLHRFLSRRAVTTIVTNNHLRELVSSWGAHSIVIGYIPGEYPRDKPPTMSGSFNVVVSTSFAPDEPIEEVFKAAALLPEVSFYVTGNFDRAPHRILASRPPYLHLTGYIPYAQYIGLLGSADATLDLTTRDHTLLLGGFEAIALGTPIIVSDWPILREYFSQGAIHVPNTVEGICMGVRQAQQEQDSLRVGIVELEAQLQREWIQRSRDLRRRLAGCA